MNPGLAASTAAHQHPESREAPEASRPLRPAAAGTEREREHLRNESRCSVADCAVSGVFSVEGLPPLPKGLSGILNSSGGSWRDIEKVHSKRARIQADISRGGGDDRGHSNPGGLDAALALLRKKMVGLRQLDMSLFCQLWSLHEAIQEYKGYSLLSDASFSDDNGYSDEEEEEDDEVEDEDEEETGVLSQPSSSPSFSLPPPSSNTRDQWIRDSFHFAR